MLTAALALCLSVSLPFFPVPQCAKSYLSVVPGKFLLFDNMKDAERSTYTFIAQMEEGGMVNAQDLVKKNAGGPFVHNQCAPPSPYPCAD